MYFLLARMRRERDMERAAAYRAARLAASDSPHRAWVPWRQFLANVRSWCHRVACRLAAVKQARFVGGGPFDGDTAVLDRQHISAGFCDRSLPAPGGDRAVARYLLSGETPFEAIFSFERVYSPPPPPPRRHR
jgi:hypothetical protein